MDDPYIKLCTAVVALAIRDACLTPVKNVDKKMIVQTDARSAIQFIWGKHVDGYCDVIDMNPDQLRRKLEALSEDRSPSDHPFTTIERRSLRFNLNHWRRG